METSPMQEAQQTSVKELIERAKALSERIEANPMMVWCRTHDVKPQELMARIEAGMSAEEVDDNRQMMRALKAECVAQAGGGETPSATAPRRAPRRMI